MCVFSKYIIVKNTQSIHFVIKRKEQSSLENC